MLLHADGYDSRVVKYAWFHPKEKAVQFDPGGKELPHMNIHDFVLEDCSYNDSSSESSAIFLFYVHTHADVGGHVMRRNDLRSVVVTKKKSIN